MIRNNTGLYTPLHIASEHTRLPLTKSCKQPLVPVFCIFFTMLSKYRVVKTDFDLMGDEQKRYIECTRPSYQNFFIIIEIIFIVICVCDSSNFSIKSSVSSMEYVEKLRNDMESQLESAIPKCKIVAESGINGKSIIPMHQKSEVLF